MHLIANGIRIEYELDGPADGPVVLLVAGLGLQLTAWPDDFVHALTGAGLRVLRMDNRDAGLSESFDHKGLPLVPWAMLRWRIGLPLHPPYTLADMAADALGLLDALRIHQAHVVGLSLGGMVAQRLALAAPRRVRTLTSIMSTSGAPRLPAARPEAMAALLRRPAGRAPQVWLEHYMRLLRTIGSPGYPMDEATLRERIAAALARSFRPAGTLRQMLAVAADRDRWRELPAIGVPTLVIHGRDDPLVPWPCGADVARRIPGARLELIDGMGHDLAPGAVARLLPPLLAHLRAQPGGAAAAAGEAGESTATP